MAKLRKSVSRETPKTKRNPKGAGRKSLYHTLVEPHLDKIRRWMAQGITESSIQACLGISEATWRLYRKTYPPFAAAVQRGKKLQIQKLDNAAFRAACGHIVRLFEDRLDRNGNKIRCSKSVYYPPDHKLYSLYRHNNRLDADPWDMSLKIIDTETGDNQLDRLSRAIEQSRKLQSQYQSQPQSTNQGGPND